MTPDNPQGRHARAAAFAQGQQDARRGLVTPGPPRENLERWYTAGWNHWVCRQNLSHRARRNPQ